MKKVLVLDNYDSFTYNLVHYIREHPDCSVEVYRNDKISLEQVAGYDLIVLSPGPGLPDEAGTEEDRQAVCFHKKNPRSLPRYAGHRRSIWRQANEPPTGLSRGGYPHLSRGKRRSCFRGYSRRIYGRTLPQLGDR